MILVTSPASRYRITVTLCGIHDSKHTQVIAPYTSLSLSPSFLTPLSPLFFPSLSVSHDVSLSSPSLGSLSLEGIEHTTQTPLCRLYQLPGTADLHVEGRNANISILEWIRISVSCIANNKSVYLQIFWKKKMRIMQIMIENNDSNA